MLPINNENHDDTMMKLNPNIPETLKFVSDSAAKYTGFKNSDNLISCSILTNPRGDGRRSRATIIECLEEFEGQLELE